MTSYWIDGKIQSHSGLCFQPTLQTTGHVETRYLMKHIWSCLDNGATARDCCQHSIDFYQDNIRNFDFKYLTLKYDFMDILCMFVWMGGGGIRVLGGWGEILTMTIRIFIFFNKVAQCVHTFLAGKLLFN